jgi:hypothetical protein
MLYKTLLLIMLTLLCIQCASKDTESTHQESNAVSTADNNRVYSYNNKAAFKTFEALQLDSTHANLLDPRIAKDSYQEVQQAWVQLHTALGTFLTEKDFKWNSSDSAIRVVHKIYFDTTGHIRHHFINVVTPSVSDTTIEDFTKLLMEFGSTHQVALKREVPFAQCGRTEYAN